jgi:hypothetical protein
MKANDISVEDLANNTATEQRLQFRRKKATVFLMVAASVLGITEPLESKVIKERKRRFIVLTATPAQVAEIYAKDWYYGRVFDRDTNEMIVRFANTYGFPVPAALGDDEEENDEK